MSETAVEAVEDGEKDLIYPADFDDGLGDFDTSDMVMPRIGIEHQEGKFVDNLTSQKFDEIEVVLLGLVKQRIMWAEDVDDGEGPLCKSVDAKVGMPSSEFDYEAAGLAKTGNPLPCDSCNFTKWSNNKPPKCAEQYTFPLLMGEGGEFNAPAILTLQKSGIKPAKSYLTAFKRSGKPLFTARTKLRLDLRKKGSVTYSVPIIEQAGNTEAEDFRMYAEQYRSIREYLHNMGDAGEDEEAKASEATADNTSKAAEGDEDLPF